MTKTVSQKPFFYFKLAGALRDCLREGYNLSKFFADFHAGIVVGIIALPLSMALAIASGMPPQNGLYTAIVAGFFIALAGGSRVQVSGPTAAFVVILLPITLKFGVAGLLLATFLAGIILFLMGVLRLGQLIQFVPYPVVTGFTSGIAVVIASLQMKDFWGLQGIDATPHFLLRVSELVTKASTAHKAEAILGGITLFFLIFWPRVTRKVPAPLIALVIGSVLAYFFEAYGWGDIQTIRDQFSYIQNGEVFHGIPQILPQFLWPWQGAGPAGSEFILNLSIFKELLLPALAIALLGAIESLLCAVVSDSMTGHKHDPDGELIAQGLGNMIAPFFGGFAATGAIARTATSLRAGAKSPIAAMIHALFVLMGVVFLAPILGYIPMTALAACLLIVAWNMSEIKHFLYVLRHGPKQDVAILLICFFLTVVTDMVIAVTVGIILSSLIFMHRMAAISSVALKSTEDLSIPDLPNHVAVYEISGPLFFGAAQKAMSTLSLVDSEIKTIIFDFRSVPTIDVTGIINLQSTLHRLAGHHIHIILAGLKPSLQNALVKAKIDQVASLEMIHDFNAALAKARQAAPLDH